jgi:hypothetical protein
MEGMQLIGFIFAMIVIAIVVEKTISNFKK